MFRHLTSILAIAFANSCFAELQTLAGGNVPDEAKILVLGRQTFNYFIPESDPSVRNGAILVIRERSYRTDYPQSNIPSGVTLVLAPGFGDKTLAVRFAEYQLYHSSDVVNLFLRNKFHQRFGNEQRTDFPLETRRFLFRFGDASPAYRSVILMRYSRTQGVESRLPFELSIDSGQISAKVTVVDFADGTDSPVRTTYTLYPASE